MAEELRFAVRCHGSRQRPALKRTCTRCSPATTYVPTAVDLSHLNGVRNLYILIDFLMKDILLIFTNLQSKPLLAIAVHSFYFIFFAVERIKTFH